MAQITVRQPIRVSRAEARKRMDGFVETLSKYGVTPIWRGDSAILKSVAVSGGIEITDASVQVTLKLGMMARAAGVDSARLEGSIRRRLAEAFDES